MSFKTQPASIAVTRTREYVCPESCMRAAVVAVAVRVRRSDLEIPLPLRSFLHPMCALLGIKRGRHQTAEKSSMKVVDTLTTWNSLPAPFQFTSQKLPFDKYSELE